MESLPQRQGTLAEVITAVEAVTGEKVGKGSKEYALYRQMLSKCCRKEKGEYRLGENAREVAERCRERDACRSVKDRLVHIFRWDLGGRGASLPLLKERYADVFGLVVGEMKTTAESNLQLWEKNILKTLSSCNGLFDSSRAKTIYSL